MKDWNGAELARAYIKKQQYTRRFSALEGLEKGTIFPELYKPYEKKKPPMPKRDTYRSFERGPRRGQ
ncbi:MAG: spore coat associated protein CotJA [Syntrophomonadaceae bacterium]|nr:spore coat associated protein CotJA [Syntrophomonadaceae bacterium]